MASVQWSGHTVHMLDVRNFKAQDLRGLSPDALAAVAEQMLAHIGEQSKHIDSQAQAIKWRDAKIQSITFQLARFKAWKFGAKTEAMNAEQRALFEETCAADQASLEAQLAALQGATVGQTAPDKQPEPPAKRQPKREALPAHLPRVDQRIEPEDTNCPTQDCGQAMVRVGEDISERLDIVPAQFFVQRQIRGKWACRCCQVLVQEPAAPQVFDNAMPTPGLQAHTMVSRFVDHIPYYRQEQINARSGVHTPRSTLAAWAGAGGAALEPLYEAHKRFVLSAAVLHADETPIPLLDPGAGKTRKAYIWAYARSQLDAQPGVIYDFCAGRGAQFPIAFLGGQSPPRAEPPWRGTLVSDRYSGYDPVLDPGLQPGRTAAACAAHARRKFEELTPRNAGASPVALEVLQRWARIYHVEGHFAGMTDADRREGRQRLSRPLWDELRAWLQLERARVGGRAIREAIDYSLNHWSALTLHLDDGAVPIDNNHLEQQIKPWKLGANNVNCVLMRTRRRRGASLPSKNGLTRVAAASHDHRDFRNCIKPFGGRYRFDLTSGGFSRARARSFIARSASTYM